MKLYEINNKIWDVIATFEAYYEENGELPETAAEELKTLKLEFSEKLEGVWAAIKNEEANRDAVAREIKRLQALKRRSECTIEWLKQYAGGELNGSAFKHKLGAFSFRRSESVEIDDLAAVPMCYCTYEKKPDKTAIKEDLKNDATVPGVRLVVKNNLQVR